MFTYQLQDRIIRLHKDVKPKFPCKVEIEAKLSPAEIFGCGNGYSRLLVAQRDVKVLGNSHTGRVLYRSNPPMQPLEIKVDSPENQFIIEGDVLRYTCKCNNEQELTGTLHGINFLIPLYFNLELPDPPKIEYINGRLGDIAFSWDHKTHLQQIRPRDAESLEKHIASFYFKLPTLNKPGNRRFIAALHYFYISSRLSVSGHGQWEFMAEGILNMCKALEILFGRKMDKVRSGLRSLGYSEESIEGDYIPLMILRDSVDVAHPRTVIFKQSELNTLYLFLHNSEDRFRDLLQRVLQKLENSEFVFPDESEFNLSTSEQKQMDKLMKQLQKRNL